jgi:hypothetical protein
MSDVRPDNADLNLDGCDVDMTVDDQISHDGTETEALVMFADVWDDRDAVEARRAELIEWDAATHPASDTEPTTGAPDV